MLLKDFSGATEFNTFYCNQHNNDTGKFAFVFDRDNFITQMHECGSLGLIVEDVEFSFLMGLVPVDDQMWVALFKKTMMKIIPTGIPQHISKVFNRADKYKNEKPQESEPFVLSLKDLDFGFLLWIASCTIPISVFVLECIIGFVFKKPYKGRDYFEDIGEVVVVDVDEEERFENRRKSV
jgi:hypothetical protein